MLYLNNNSAKRPTFKSTNKVCYLLLDIGIPTQDSRVVYLKGGEETHSLKDQVLVAQKACKKMGVRLKVIEIRRKESKNLNKDRRFIFHVPYFRKDDKKITKAIEAFLFSLALFTPPEYIGNNFAPYYRFPSFLIRDDSYILASELRKLEEDKPFHEKFPSSDLLSYGTSGGQYDYIKAWKFAPIVFAEKHLFNAVRFLANSQQHFYIYPGELDEVIYNPEEQTKNSLVQNSLEEALLNSFKAIEAVLGNLPRKDKKLFNKMLEIGLNPQELVGYVDKQPLYQHIRKTEKFRDSKSAHGRSIERDISFLDMTEFQECAKTVVYHGIRAKMESYWQ